MSITTMPSESTFLKLKQSGWLPLLILPLLAVWLGEKLPPWGAMWLLAGSVYAGLKWLSFADYARKRETDIAEATAYLLCWPGMNAAGFFGSQQAKSISRWGMLGVLLKIGLGLLLLVQVAPSLLTLAPLLAAWAALTGFYFLLHSGTFHALALLWQSQGRDTELLMHWPVLASSVSNYWGARWNTAFRDLAQRFVFRPLIRNRYSAAVATMAVFLISGLVHDLVISLPAQGGWGLPTVYFVLQGLFILLERSSFGRRCGLGTGLRGRIAAWVTILLPAPLLFHSPFLNRVILPMVQTISEKV